MHQTDYVRRGNCLNITHFYADAFMWTFLKITNLLTLSYEIQYETSRTTLSSVPLQKDKALIMEITRRLTAALADDSHPWNTEKEGWELNGIAQDLIRNALDCVTYISLFS